MKPHVVVDPITVEVIRNRFIGIANQMRSVLVRTSFNPVIYEMVDFAIGIYRRDFQLIALDPGIPIFVGALGIATEAMVTGAEAQAPLEEGDVIISNYPPESGAHANDVCLCTPVMFGGECFGYITSKAHWMDVGGKDVLISDSTDVYQEGILFRSLKIRKKGKLDGDLVNMIQNNSRLGELAIADMSAQMAAGDFGRNAIVELLEKYGKAAVIEAIDISFDQAEQITRDAIRALPNGIWEAEGALDDDGIHTGTPIPIKLRLTISDDTLVFDAAGSHAATEGPMNSPYGSSYATMMFLSKALLTPDLAANQGCFRPMDFVAEPGSLFNAQLPAAVAMYGWSLMPLFEVGLKALAEAVPERGLARSGGDLGTICFSAPTPGGGVVAGAINEAQGQGAGTHGDGTNGLMHSCLGDQTNIPVEVIEQRWPLLFDWYRLREDSGGPGLYRGGLGVEKSVAATTDLRLVALQEQHTSPAWGLVGGGEGVRAECTLRDGTPNQIMVNKVTGFKLPKGERFVVRGGGGGGWGDPLQRPVDSVLDDVVEGYVSVASARDHYGVVIADADDGVLEVDRGATGRLRAMAAGAGISES